MKKGLMPWGSSLGRFKFSMIKYGELKSKFSESRGLELYWNKSLLKEGK